MLNVMSSPIDLSREEVLRYSRHLLIPEVGFPFVSFRVGNEDGTQFRSAINEEILLRALPNSQHPPAASTVRY